MRRDQLEHAIRTACQIIGGPEVIVVGSQAILGSFDETQLPADATMSLEIDILPIAEDNAETARLADLIEGVAGEFSPFEDLHGFSIDGVDMETSALPDGWQSRLVKVQNANTAALLESGLVAPDVIARRLPTVQQRYKPASEHAFEWIRSWL